MSTNNTIRMIAAYESIRAPIMFLAGFFQSPPENFHSSEDIEIDIMRDDEDVSIVVQDIAAGYRENSADIFTNKKLTPPVHKESMSFNAYDLIKREFGENPYESPDFQGNLAARMMRGMRKMEGKIRRAIEQQAAQILQTGTVTLTDGAGAALFTLDYSPKATHFPTAGTAWNAPGSDKIKDLSDMAEVIRNDGLTDPDVLLFGIDAFESFISDEAVQKRLDVRRINVGEVQRSDVRGNGGTFRGTVDIGNYTFDMWTYGGKFKDAQTGDKVSFLEADKVVMLSSGGRLDATFGAIPNIGKMLGVNNPSDVLPANVFPSRFSSPQGSIDMHTNVWLTPNGEAINGGIGVRPLLIPTAIDTYGCLTTGL